MGSFSGLPIELGAGKEVRTPDLYLGKVSLYQLSYSRITGRQFNKQSKRKHYSLRKPKNRTTEYPLKALLAELS
jgi:hypothetical protein